MMFRILAAAAVVAALFGLPAAAQAAPDPYRHCSPPIAGYLIRDTDHASPDWRGAEFFPADGTWNFTAGQFVGWGGTYEIVACKEARR
jgi:opacity protein-like surface antigen